jgi:hypothetical protein
MSPAPSAKALASAKVRRQKQILAVGSVILLALLGFELPKMLKHGSNNAAPATPAVTAASSGPALAAASGTLPDTDRVSIVPQVGQLLSFGLFKGKDPFIQQLATTPTPLPPAPSTKTQPTVTTTTPKPPPPASLIPPPTTTSATTGSTTTTATSPSTTTPGVPPAAPTSVLLSTNGTCETVALNGTFPATENIFRLVWIAKDGSSVKIAVVGGAYDSGQATATVKRGETLTLVNTADGTRYVIALKTRCDARPPAAAATTAATSTTATTTTSPTTTATTPIITDALDTTTPTG